MAWVVTHVFRVYRSSVPRLSLVLVKIAKPLLLVSTPLGMVFGLREAYRFHWWLAGLMAALMAVIGAFLWMTWTRVRRELR